MELILLLPLYEMYKCLKAREWFDAFFFFVMISTAVFFLLVGNRGYSHVWLGFAPFVVTTLILAYKRINYLKKRAEEVYEL